MTKKNELTLEAFANTMAVMAALITQHLGDRRPVEQAAGQNAYVMLRSLGLLPDMGAYSPEDRERITKSLDQAGRNGAATAVQASSNV